MYLKTTIIGNLGADPQMRYLPNGTAVTNYSVATERVWFDKATEKKQTETTWVKVVVWGKQAENNHKYLAKGKRVFVEGRVSVEVWNDKKSGEAKGQLVMTADNVIFLSTTTDGSSHVEASDEAALEDHIPF